MQATQLSLKDYMAKADKFNAWFDDIAAQSSGEFTREGIAGVISGGTHHGWGWTTDEGEVVGVIISSVVPYAEYKCLSIVGAAGDATDYEQLHGFFNALAQQLECSRFEIRGRRGFVKKFSEMGWKEKYTVIECEVVKNVTPIQGEENQDGHGQISGDPQAHVGHSA
jgi:hypothetical protein